MQVTSVICIYILSHPETAISKDYRKKLCKHLTLKTAAFTLEAFFIFFVSALFPGKRSQALR